MIKFEVGKTYYDRSSCDYDTIFSFKIVKRSNKSVWIEDEGKLVRRGITVWNNEESFYPFGKYSMCAVVNAKREFVEEKKCENNIPENVIFVNFNTKKVYKNENVR
jgi:hypothetical protein